MVSKPCAAKLVDANWILCGDGLRVLKSLLPWALAPLGHALKVWNVNPSVSERTWVHLNLERWGRPTLVIDN